MVPLFRTILWYADNKGLDMISEIGYNEFDHSSFLYNKDTVFRAEDGIMIRMIKMLSIFIIAIVRD